VSGGWTQRERVHEVGTPQTFLTWEDGFSVNGAVGYEFSFVRAELEVGLANTDVDIAGARVPNVGDFSSPADGNVSLRKYMFNLYHDFKFGDFALKPYVGAGIGFYQSEINGLFPEFFTGHGLADSGVNATSDFPFAYQLKAGASYEISERTELFIGYTFLTATPWPPPLRSTSNRTARRLTRSKSA
jgi:opacity protein-like surface antigen